MATAHATRAPTTGEGGGEGQPAVTSSSQPVSTDQPEDRTELAGSLGPAIGSPPELPCLRDMKLTGSEWYLNVPIQDRMKKQA